MLNVPERFLTLKPPSIMLNALNCFLASSVPTVQVPDSGMTVALMTGGVLTLGLVARFMKNRKK